MKSKFILYKMARMHSRRKGKSGSTKPLKKKKVTWLLHKPSEIEGLIVKLAKAGKTMSEIGVTLRDSYGVPDVKKILGKSVSMVLHEHNIQKKLPEDFTALIKKEINILKHLEKNKKDMSGLRGLQLTESKIKRLTIYYKRMGVLPPDWVYDREKIKLLIE